MENIALIGIDLGKNSCIAERFLHQSTRSIFDREAYVG